jgi:hypothetical protein
MCVYTLYSVYTPMYEGFVVSNYTQVGLLYAKFRVADMADIQQSTNPLV